MNTMPCKQSTTVLCTPRSHAVQPAAFEAAYAKMLRKERRRSALIILLIACLLALSCLAPLAAVAVSTVRDARIEAIAGIRLTDRFFDRSVQTTALHHSGNVYIPAEDLMALLPDAGAPKETYRYDGSVYASLTQIETAFGNRIVME